MTDVYGPFDGITWTQDAWYRHAPKWVPSGVNGSPAASTTTGDLPITFSGLNFTVGVGRAWVRGAGFERTGTPASQAIPANTNASLSRRDRVVLRRDLAAKTVAPVLIQGTASASPTAPAIQQVETGQWDSLLYSFLTPPNSGTSITGIVDERVWVDPGGIQRPRVFATRAARDTYFPSPVAGDQCVCLGTQMTHDGTAWRFTLSGVWSGGTDASGFFSIPHGGGQAPVGWVITPGYQVGDATNFAVHTLSSSNPGDATNLGGRAMQGNAYYGAGFAITVTWMAQF